ncbi:protein yippee-like 1 isoform X2 [Chiroxiphia lanceolata]|uniref:protein yippee-like 1 isoform X2 n=1 Tax=Chiroxiphia lanceolata TaxID=296741 RepID=UPI0013CE82A5|nr:protein yippee-like 1 isoform X2 [Chiroxiphia lanceolata]
MPRRPSALGAAHARPAPVYDPPGGHRRDGTFEAREAVVSPPKPPSLFEGEGPALTAARAPGVPPPSCPCPLRRGARGLLIARAGSGAGVAVVTVSLLSFVWKVPHTLQNNNGFCLHIPVFLLSASSAKL